MLRNGQVRVRVMKVVAHMSPGRFTIDDFLSWARAHADPN
jgi:hypothetical protein